MSGQQYVRWESPWTARLSDVRGDGYGSRDLLVDAPASGPDDRKPISEAYEHASKEPCSRFNRPASS